MLNHLRSLDFNTEILKLPNWLVDDKYCADLIDIIEAIQLFHKPYILSQSILYIRNSIAPDNRPSSLHDFWTTYSVYMIEWPYFF